jgi:hypothetical protein
LFALALPLLAPVFRLLALGFGGGGILGELHSISGFVIEHLSARHTDIRWCCRAVSGFLSVSLWCTAPAGQPGTVSRSVSQSQYTNISRVADEKWTFQATSNKRTSETTCRSTARSLQSGCWLVCLIWWFGGGLTEC